MKWFQYYLTFHESKIFQQYIYIAWNFTGFQMFYCMAWKPFCEISKLYLLGVKLTMCYVVVLAGMKIPAKLNWWMSTSWHGRMGEDGERCLRVRNVFLQNGFWIMCFIALSWCFVYINTSAEYYLKFMFSAVFTKVWGFSKSYLRSLLARVLKLRE